MASLSPHSHQPQAWHFDCRLSKELPDDSPVSGRFLANVLCGTLAALALLYTAITLYHYRTVDSDIVSCRQQIQDNSAQMAELEKVISAIQSGARRLGAVQRLAGNPLPVSEFIQEIGRTRPPVLRIDMIEFANGAAFIRGGLHESSQRASALLGQYVTDLRADPQLRPLFASIALTSLERNAQAGTVSFEINLKLKAPAP